MKKILSLALVLFVGMAFTACDDESDDNKTTTPQELSMTWVGNENFEQMELQKQMNVNIKIKAEAGIKDLVVKISSDVLEQTLATLGIDSGKLDLVRDQDVIEILNEMTQGTLPTGDKLMDKTEVDFNISSLLPLIPALKPENGTYHIFTITLEDNDGQKLNKECTFFYKGEASIAVSEANLWDNTASVKAVFVDSVVAPKLLYRVKGTTHWAEAQYNADSCTFAIAPEWEASVNDAGINVYALKEGTGIFAGNTYELALKEGEETIDTAEYTAAEGDVIPNGNMSGWSRKTMTMSGTDYKITYPNVEGDSAFWDSGNNMFLEQYDENDSIKVFTPLCMQDNEAAMLSARKVLGTVFAPGNMYTGDFNYSGLSGTANFGKKYDWTARPKSLKVSYKAIVDTIDNAGSHDPEGADWKDKQDISRIYAAVIDWSAQHGVTSGMTVPTGMWDPCKQDSVAEGRIIGYASLEINASQDAFKAVEIPFFWYDTEAKPAEGNYSIVISCATSNRGDYLTGSSENVLHVDDFEWGY